MSNPLAEPQPAPRGASVPAGAVVPGDSGNHHLPPEQCRLQDLMPEIQRLAQRVGGLKTLSALIDNMIRDAG